MIPGLFEYYQYIFFWMAMVMKAATRFLSFALFFNCIAAVLFGAETQKPSLSAAVFFGFPSAKELKQNNQLKTDTCLQKYFNSITEKSSLLLDYGTADLENSVKYKRHNLEEQVVTIMGDRTRDEAKAFSLAVPLYTEWEGMSECPLTEAEFVEKWLGKHPHSRIASFLHLFKAHRLRSAYEAARARHEESLWPALRVKYKESLDKAMSSDNSLISCIAQDLEAQSYVYLEGYGRP
jgi:hypothetical protein